MSTNPSTINELGPTERTPTAFSEGMSAICRRFGWKDPSPDSFVKIEVLAHFGGARESNAVPRKGNSTQKSIGCIVPMQHQRHECNTHARGFTMHASKPRLSCDAHEIKGYTLSVVGHVRLPGFEPGYPSPDGSPVTNGDLVERQPSSARHPAPTKSKAK